MDLKDFKQLVQSEFGRDLKHATPANVREFLDRMQQDVFQPKTGERIEISETATSYEEIIKDFFSRILESPPEEAVISLWTVALELSFAAIESHDAERFADLFRDLEE